MDNIKNKHKIIIFGCTKDIIKVIILFIVMLTIACAAHEASHAIATILTGGKVTEIKYFPPNPYMTHIGGNKPIILVSGAIGGALAIIAVCKILRYSNRLMIWGVTFNNSGASADFGRLCLTTTYWAVITLTIAMLVSIKYYNDYLNDLFK